MATFFRKPEVVQAFQWFKNGDHPEDGEERHPTEGWLYEGKVVRYYRHPSIGGAALCPKCHIIMHDHGWIDRGYNGQNVCPGDWVISSEHEFYACSPDLFQKLYQLFEYGSSQPKPERTSMRIRKL